MAGEKKIETPDSVAAVLKPEPFTNLVGQDVASGNGTPSILNSSISSSGDATSGIKGETGQESVAEQGAYYPPTSYYDYHYPGYNGNFSQSNDHNHFKAGDGSYTGFQTDNGSVLYYMPGYDPYGQQPYYSSPGYLQHPVSYGSEAMSCYTWNSACVGDVANGTTGFPWKSKAAHGFNTSTKSNDFSSIKSSEKPASKFSTLPLDSKSRRSAASTYGSKSILESQPLKTVGKLGSGYESASLYKGFHPGGKFSPFVNQNQGLLMHNSPMSYRPNGRAWNGNNNRSKPRDKHTEFDASTELTRGPRGQNTTNSSNLSEELLGPTVRRELYNQEEFETEYDNAKFFVIKSYSEDDVHKCIKYDVWSSTPNGNKKLDAAFHDAEAKASETGTKCPVFLFFSVNGSGQFVGVAEMVGPVDFKKDMEFWQLDKWNGFFPVKWHVIKDTPNTQLWHIILENNDNRPVTFSRDTQEIGFKQGIEMLNIFKSYSAKNSILDDFNFYENREKLLKAKRINKEASSETDIYNNHNFPNHLEAARPRSSDPASSLINLTKNLSLNSHSPKSGAATNPRGNSVPAISASKAI